MRVVWLGNFVRAVCVCLCVCHVLRRRHRDAFTRLLWNLAHDVSECGILPIGCLLASRIFATYNPQTSRTAIWTFLASGEVKPAKKGLLHRSVGVFRCIPVLRGGGMWVRVCVRARRRYIWKAGEMSVWRCMRESVCER